MDTQYTCGYLKSSYTFPKINGSSNLCKSSQIEKNNFNWIGLLLAIATGSIPCLLYDNISKCDLIRPYSLSLDKSKTEEELYVTYVTTENSASIALITIVLTEYPPIQGTLPPYFAPIFKQICDNNNICIRKENPNVIYFKNGGKYYIVPKLKSLEWTSTLTTATGISTIVISVWINLNDIYGLPVIYSIANIAIGTNGPYTVTGIAYDPTFIYQIDVTSPLSSGTLILPPDSNVSFTLGFQVSYLTPPLAGQTIVFTPNEFELEIIKLQD